MPRGAPVTIEPPPLKYGEERRHMHAVGREDTASALERAKEFSWHVAIVGRPWRLSKWWLFTVRTDKLP